MISKKNALTEGVFFHLVFLVVNDQFGHRRI